MNHRATLKRGFALVRDEAGWPVFEVGAVTAGARLEIEFGDGRVGVTADGGEEAATVSLAPVAPEAAPRRVKPKRDVVDQGTLF